MDGENHQDSVQSVAVRLAELLTGGGSGARDATARDMIYEEILVPRPLRRLTHTGPVTAVDGGQALVADARCLQVYVTRWARAGWDRDGCPDEQVGPLDAHILGLGEERRSLANLGAPVDPDASVDVNLLRDWAEWSAVARSVEEAGPGTLVLVDGDLQPDWRIHSGWLAALFANADERGVELVGVTKHTSLSWGAMPLLGYLERLAGDSRSEGLGPRSLWWAPVGRTRPDVTPGIQVTVARLDPDARFSFRVDLAGHLDAGEVLGRLSSLCDDAAFPGYPYPLSVADGLAACPSWVRDETWARIDAVLEEAGVEAEVRERAFTDRHRLMERR
jgi:hypothetical protein